MKQSATKPPNKVRAHVQTRSFPPDLPASAWLAVEEVLQYVPVSRAGWYRGVRSGMFPAPTHAGRLAFWKARDIRALLDLGPRRPRKLKARRPPQDAPHETPDPVA